MKGIVFTEFLELVEDKFGIEMVDKIISQSELDSGGAYTTIGTYKFSEMLQLVTNLSANSDIPVDKLLLIYGEHFFNVLKANYSGLLDLYTEPLEMLSSIENHIHVEVKKLYPDAELPTFDTIKRTDDELIMIYKSSRALHHFGLGLMNKTFEHFNSKASILLEKIKEDGTEVRFSIKME
ncbi:MAG: heme NO-binding domain-containing protein [Bacteroidia bacterium]|nr:heme NO-binding domain-containing protein [Bacteroidia bacterium]MBT8287451.1 heme NO-binding domain-containing protein [Bacteroidia bacterium]NNF81817.1 heme NO-binding domain-containing protein [Flavobacteriaceae bacterium]NNK72626.1 heme NO-binding domain-containing protein [Flavobacteriaceae bacterium]